MATCRVCSATLTDDPAQVDGSYGEDRSGITLLESQVSKALGENLCTHHWTQVLEGNDNTAITLPGVADPHGAGQHSDVTRELFLPANEGHIKTGTPGDRRQYGAVKGLANSTEPNVFFTIKVPDDFVSFTKVEAIWVCVAASGNMRWKLTANYAASGEADSTHLDAPAENQTVTGGNGIINVQESANPLTLANLATGDFLGISFIRKGVSAFDTLNTDMYFFGLLFTYVAHQ